MLSYVEWFSPQYVLIENVTGLLHYRLNGTQEGSKIVGGIEGGMVKFILRVLTSLGSVNHKPLLIIIHKG